MWKGRLLFMVGRLCLVKSVINALPLFYFSFFRASKQVCKTIRSIQINFLRGWGPDGKKIPRVAWEKICLPVEKVGL